MFNRLIQLDIDLFLWLNSHHNLFFDRVMLFISGKLEWLPLYIILLGVIIYKYRLKSLWIFISIIILIALSDNISTLLIKNTIERLRPSHNPALQGLVHLVNGRGGLYGFVSSHAANTFALATFLSLLFQKRWFSIPVFAWASVVSYSRIYLGVHYPADIIGGAFIGVILGMFVFRFYAYLINRYSGQTKNSEHS